jgi:hypothetical protein
VAATFCCAAQRSRRSAFGPACWTASLPPASTFFVVTHKPATDWEHADTAPFTFVDGVV